MGARINRKNFQKDLVKLTFNFDMTNHLDPLISEDESLTAICEKISSYHQLTYPNWTRLRAEFRIIEITIENELFKYIDAKSQRKVRKWLIFSLVCNQINVSHFGPLEKNKDKDFDDNVDQTRLSLKQLKHIWLKVRTSSLPENPHSKILAELSRVIQATKEKIEAKKIELTTVAITVCDCEKSRKSITNSIETIDNVLGLGLVRANLKIITELMRALIAKEIAQVAVKQTAKQGAKTVTKGSAKSTAKAIPFVGLVVGTGLAVVRLAMGDSVGAGMEFASGAASCAPGLGTAASFAIDGCLVVKDVMSLAEIQRKKFEALKASIERIETELTRLLEECEKAKTEYDFVCDLLGDPGYEFEKLECDIKVLDEVFHYLNNN